MMHTQENPNYTQPRTYFFYHLQIKRTFCDGVIHFLLPIVSGDKKCQFCKKVRMVVLLYRSPMITCSPKILNSRNEKCMFLSYTYTVLSSMMTFFLPCSGRELSLCLAYPSHIPPCPILGCQRERERPHSCNFYYSILLQLFFFTSVVNLLLCNF